MAKTAGASIKRRSVICTVNKPMPRRSLLAMAVDVVEAARISVQCSAKTCRAGRLHATGLGTNRMRICRKLKF